VTVAEFQECLLELLGVFVPSLANTTRRECTQRGFILRS